jgi:hypothetical protein
MRKEKVQCPCCSEEFKVSLERERLPVYKNVKLDHIVAALELTEAFINNFGETLAKD